MCKKWAKSTKNRRQGAKYELKYEYLVLLAHFLPVFWRKFCVFPPKKVKFSSPNPVEVAPPRGRGAASAPRSVLMRHGRRGQEEEHLRCGGAGRPGRGEPLAGAADHHVGRVDRRTLAGSVRLPASGVPAHGHPRAREISPQPAGGES